MSALVLLQSGRTPDWVEIIVVVLLLFGGAIQAIFRAVREKAAKAKGRPPGSARELPQPSTEPDALERWRELARGGSPPIVVDPQELAPRRRPRPRRPQPDESEPAEPPPVPVHTPWSQLAEQGAFAAFGEGPSEEELERRLDEARGTEDQLVSPQHRGPARVRADVPLRTRLRNRHAWRAAIVSAEVLGRPVGLRRPEELPGNAAR